MSKRIAIVDTSTGNLRSVEKALRYIGYDAYISADPGVLMGAAGLVLPGVGAFADAMHTLRQTGLDGHIRAFIGSGRPFLGICLGAQLLLQTGAEHGLHTGLQVLAGTVQALPPGRIVPHMGWNTLDIRLRSPLFSGLGEHPAVYFVHSYHAVPADPSIIAATCMYAGCPVTAALQRGNVYATQFHPEKSGDTGLQILKNFGALL